MLSKNFDKNSDEKILLRSNHHPSMFYGGVIFLIYYISVVTAGNVFSTTANEFDLGSIIIISGGVLWTVVGFLRWTYTEYILTNQRLEVISGYFYLRTKSYSIDKIEHVTLYQNWTDKWWGKGIVTLFGIGIQTKRIKGLNNAVDFRDAIHSQLSVDPEPYFSN